jgi:hypothetical protein
MLHIEHPDYSSILTNSSIAAATWGTSVSSAASANTYGSWVQIHAGLTYPSAFLLLRLSNNWTAATTRNAYVDIGIGPDAGNVTTIADKLCGSHAGSFAASSGPSTYFLPLRIPAGTPIWARHQNTVASKTIGVHLTAYCGDNLDQQFPSAQSMVSLNSTTASTTGTTITVGASGAEGGWTEMIASTTEDYVGLMVGGMFAVDTTLTAVGYVLDVGIGASGQEISVGENVLITTHNTSENAQRCAYPAFASIATGSRVSIRGSCSGAADSSLSAIAYGLKG